MESRTGRGDHQCSLATEVNKLLREEVKPPPSQCLTHNHSKQAHDALKSLAFCITTKLEGGDFRGAVQGKGKGKVSIADQNEELLAALRSKHPPAHPTHTSLHSPPMVSEDEVIKPSAPSQNGSAGGPDGLHPQHLKDFNCVLQQRREAGIYGKHSHHSPTLFYKERLHPQFALSSLEPPWSH